MSILTVNKDHLTKHVGVQPVGTPHIEAPETGDPLVFWTKHPTDPVEVNLHEFATGKSRGNSGRKFVPFSGRPALLAQMLPALQEQMTYAARRSVAQFFTALRNWWRVLDSVESAAANAGEATERVEDVRLMTNVHAEGAYRRQMTRTHFGKIRSLVDVTRLALGVRATHWEIPEDAPAQKHLPPEDQRKLLRVAVKRECRKVLERWATCEELKDLDAPPEDPEQAKLWACVRHLQTIRSKTGKSLPSTHELNNASYKQWTQQHLEAGLRFIRATAFPDCRDALAVWTQCLINTPWNPSTLLSLNVNQRFLFDHFKDDPIDPHRRWVLVGQKERAGGKEQFVFGMWKTLDGPGHLIKTYLDRVEPLRDILKVELASAQARYLRMKRNGKNEEEVIGDVNGLEEAGKLFARIAALKQGCASVWLFVNQKGEVNWLQEPHSHYAGYVDGKSASYLDEICHDLNLQRVSRGEKPLPKVSPKDFRVWFADYVYRSTQGSILAVRSALGHSSVGTSVRYVDTNVRNQEASDSARKFLEILLDELDHGRIDLTILAHLYRHGKLTPEQEKHLADLRSLPRSREGVACKNAYHPPAHLRATPGEACDVQRCLLCLEHAVILPESLDGIAMREAELRAMQNFMPTTTWVEGKYDIELENHKLALRRFDVNHVIAARLKWSQAITRGEHLIPGVPSEEIVDLTEPT